MFLLESSLRMSERSNGSAFKSHSHNGMRKRGRISRIGENDREFRPKLSYDNLGTYVEG